MKNVSIFKNTDKVPGSSAPDYRMVASWKVGEEWKSVTVGSLWKGDGGNGPALKGTMSDEYTDKEGKNFPGFEIKRAEPVVPEPRTDAPVTDDVSPEDIPF